MAARGSGGRAPTRSAPARPSARPSTASRAAKPATSSSKAPPKARTKSAGTSAPKAPTAKGGAPKPAAPQPAAAKSSPPRLIILGGFAGTGKTSIAIQVCKALGAAHVRVDTAEHALLSSLGKDFELKALGYRVAYAIAEDNLRNGLSVVADSVNPWGVTRAAWMRVASRCDVKAIEVEIICSDAEVHQKRLAKAKPDEAGVKPPTWEEVMARHYEPWSRERIVIDTAYETIDEAAALLLASLDS